MKLDLLFWFLCFFVLTSNIKVRRRHLKRCHLKRRHLKRRHLKRRHIKHQSHFEAKKQ